MAGTSPAMTSNETPPMAAPKILVLPGTARIGSNNIKLAALAVKELTLIDAEVTRISLSDYPLPIYEDDLESRTGPPANAVRLKQMMMAHQGVLITSPEYSASVTPLLKNAIDWVSRMKDQPFKEKPVAIQSASQGPLGGARMQYHWRMSMTFLAAFIFGTPEVFIGLAQTKFDKDTLELKDQPTKDAIKAQLAAFSKFIERVKA